MITEQALATALFGFARLAGWAWFDPLLGRLPRVARLVFAAALTAGIWPRLLAWLPAHAVVAPFSLAGGLALLLEFAWGVLLALMVQLVFAAVRVAFAWTGTVASGGWLSIAPAYPDTAPADTLETSWLRLAFWLAALAFLAANGHLLVIDTLLHTLTVMPIAGVPGTGQLGDWVAAGGGLVLAGLRLALPLLMFLLIVQLVFGVLLRHSSGFGVRSVGLALGAGSLLLVWIWSVPQIAPTLAAGLQQLGRGFGGPG